MTGQRKIRKGDEKKHKKIRSEEQRRCDTARTGPLKAREVKTSVCRSSRGIKIYIYMLHSDSSAPQTINKHGANAPPFIFSVQERLT